MTIKISFYRHEGTAMVETTLLKSELNPDYAIIRLYLHVPGQAEKIQIASTTIPPSMIMPISGDSPRATTFGLLCGRGEQTSYWVLPNRADVQQAYNWLKEHYNV